MGQPAQAFWDKMAAQYAAEPIADPAAYQAMLDRIISYLQPGDHVVELGAGTGSTALVLAPHVARYDLTDFSAEMIAIAAAKTADVENITCDQIAADDPDLPRGVDVVLALNLLHLMKDVPKSLRLMNGMIAPGSFLISNTVVFQGLGRLLWLPIKVMQLFGKAPHVTTMTQASLERMVKAAGFEVVSCEMLPRKGRTCMIVARAR